MKLKHLFFSSLLLSTAFVACTNEDILENPSVDAKEGIALGEGYTISVVDDAQSRAVITKDKLEARWEKDDVMGGAWFHRVTSLDNDGLVDQVASFTTSGFYSNHPFYLSKGAGTNNAEFTARTNAFAGAYVLYHPYDANFVMDNGTIDVKDIPATLTMNCATGHEMDAVNENLFVYGVNKLVPGGEQTQEVKLKQLPVLYRVKFRFGPELRLSLTKPVTIAKIVLEAKDNQGTVLTTDGTIAPNNNVAAINASNYNNPKKDAEGNIIADHNLPEAVYKGSETKTTDHITVNILNGNKAAYQISKLETLTQEYFYFSTLPFLREATKVVFKIVTTDGLVFKAEYEDNASQLAGINGTENAPGALSVGGMVDLNVTLKVQETDNVLYTKEQFKEAWAAAMKSSVAPEVILIGEDIVLDEDLEYNQVNGHAVTVKAHCDDHSLTVNNLYATSGYNVTFENPVIVKNEVVTSASSELTAEDLTAKNITANGTAYLNVQKADLLKIVGSGDVTLTEVADKMSRIKNIVVESTKGQNGVLRVSSYTISDLDNKGTVYVGEGVEIEGTVANNSSVNVAEGEELINNGILNQYGDIDGKFVNAAGAVMNIYRANAADDFDVIVNEAKTAYKSAGVININTNVAGSATPGNYVAFGVGSENKGIVNIQKGMLGSESEQVELQKTSEAVINVSKNAALYPYKANIAGGRVYMLSAESKVTDVENVYVYFPVSSIVNDDWTTVPTIEKAANLVVDTPITVNSKVANVLKAHHLYLKANLTLTENFNTNMKVIVEGASMLASNNTTQRVFTLGNKNNKIQSNGHLTLKYVKLTGDDDAELENEGGITIMTGGENDFKKNSSATVTP